MPLKCSSDTKEDEVEMTQTQSDKGRHNVYTPRPLRIVGLEDMTEDVRLFKTRFEDEEFAKAFDYVPSQFMMLSLFGIGEAPFALSGSPTSDNGILQFGIRKAGTLTEAIFKLKEGDVIGARGPFGNSFPVQDMKGKNIIFVAGGVGAVPLRSVLTYTLDKRDEYGDLFFLYGTRTPKDLLFSKEFQQLATRSDISTYLAVEDKAGMEWEHYTGLVTNLFPMLPALDPAETYAVICGPPVMYKFVLEKLLEMKLPKHQILMTLERRMKCGVGKCGHCAIDSVYTCIDGPVFSYWDAMRFKEAI